MTVKKNWLKKFVAALIMTLVTCLFAPIHVELSFTPVPMSFGTLTVCISAAVLGWKFGLISIILYLLLGICGLPVFAGGVGGAAVLTGPTGGYLLGYLLCTLLTGWMIGRDRFKFYIYPVAMLFGTLLCYAAGVLGLSINMEISISRAIRLGFSPFLIFEAIKLIAATLIGYFTSTRLRFFFRK